jgi:hypothetical protein
MRGEETWTVPGKRDPATQGRRPESMVSAFTKPARGGDEIAVRYDPQFRKQSNPSGKKGGRLTTPSLLSRVTRQR